MEVTCIQLSREFTADRKAECKMSVKLNSPRRKQTGTQRQFRIDHIIQHRKGRVRRRN
jgi:hypothetical protein